jgi:uncharacterized Ntn-hydrolase superfamily protein
MTFSIVARCQSTGQLGVAVASSSPAVAARCAHVRAGVGAVATQNVTNPALGPLMLHRLEAGDGAAAAVAAAVDADHFPSYRQLLAVDATGASAVHSGARALGTWNAVQGAQCAAGGNLLANDGVPAAMVEAFESADGALASRLINALRAGLAAGGEAGPVHSAGVLVAHEEPWPYIDLRADWLDDGCPVDAVARAWEVYSPQADDYVRRALDPAAAPSFAVPGDE